MLDRLDLDQIAKDARIQRERNQQRRIFNTFIGIALVIFTYSAGVIMFYSDGSVDVRETGLILFLIGFLFYSIELLVVYYEQRIIKGTRNAIRQVLPDLADKSAIPPNGEYFILLLIVVEFSVTLLLWILPLITPLLRSQLLVVFMFPVLALLLVTGKRIVDRVRFAKLDFVRPFRVEIIVSLFMTIVFSPFPVAIFWASDLSISVGLFEAVIIVLLYFVFIARPLQLAIAGPLLRVNGALEAANYALALDLVEGEIQRNPHLLPFLGRKAAILKYSSEDLDDAEIAFYHALTEADYAKNATQSGLVCQLADVFVLQERYPEALTLYQTSIEIAPAQWSSFIGLADVYLKQGINVNRAVALLKQAEVNKQVNMKTNRSSWAKILVGQAWAFTLLNQPAKSDVLIEKALLETDKDSKPELAALHYRIGQIMVLRNDKTKAEKYFKQSLEVDSNGIYATFASNKLNQFSL